MARDANTSGLKADHLSPDAWRFRDFVILSLNAYMPLEHLNEDQVAGDELQHDESEAGAASMLYCVGPALQESAMVEGQLDHE